MRTAAFAICFAVLAAQAARAACPPGSIDLGVGGGCMACNAEEYTAKNQCLRCPVGFTTNPQRTGCVKAKAPGPRCGPGEIYSGGFCGPCPTGDVVVNNACKACPPPLVANAAKNACVKAPPPAPCPPGTGIAPGMGCFPCAGADEIGANNRCTRCPSGQVPDATRGKCVLSGGNVPCAIGYVHRGPKLCVPCGATQIVRNNACVACVSPKRPDALRLSCVQTPVPAACPAAERLEVGRFGQYQDILASLPADQRAALDALAARLRKSFDRGCRPIRSVTLVGHADHDPSVGAAFEQQVSEKRAKALRDELVRQLGPSLAGRIRFSPSGVGARDLKHAPARTMQEMIENRRVVISTSN